MSESKLCADSLRHAWGKALSYHEQVSDIVSRETGVIPLDMRALAAVSENGLWEELSCFAGEVLRENRYTSLVSRKNPEEIIHHNILDSLILAAAWMQVPRGTSPLFLDAGTGSGVPGLPATLLLRHQGIDARLILIESNQKKQDFLKRISADLEGVHVFGGRLESERLPALLQTLSTPKHAATLTSRALATIERTLAWARELPPLLQEALFFKGPETATQEIRSAASWTALGWRLEEHWVFRFSRRETHLLRLLPFS